MTTIDELRVLLSGDNRGLKRAVDESDRSLNRLEETSNRIGRGDGFAKAALVADRMGGAINRAMGVMTRLDLVQITLEQSADRVRVAQEKYAAAVEEFGQHSTKAVDAQRELNLAQAAAEKASLRAKASYILVSAEIVSMGAMAVRAANNTTLLGTSMAGATVAARGLRLALIGTGIGALVVGLGFLLEKMNTVRSSTEQLVQRNQAAEDSEKRVAAAIEGGSAAMRTQIAAREADIASLEKQMLARARLLHEQDPGMDPSRSPTDIRLPIPPEDPEIQRLAELLGVAKTGIEQLKAELAEGGAAFEELTRAMSSAGTSLADFTLAQQRLILEADGLTEVEQRYLATAQAEDELLRRMVDNNPEILNRMSMVLRYGETLDDLATRLGLTTDQEDALRASGQLTTDGLITQAEAMERAAKASGKAAEEMARLQEEQERADFTNLQSALQGAGVDLNNMTSDMQRAIFAANGMSGVENQFILLQQAEDLLLQSALDVVPALLDQISVQRKKGETNEQLAKRLGLTVEQEKELLAAGRLTVDGIITEQEKLRRFGARDSGRFSVGASAFSVKPIMAAEGFNGVVREATPFIAGERGPERVTIEPLGRDAGRGGGVTNIHVTVQNVEVPVSMAPARFDPQQTADAVERTLTESLRRMAR